MNNPAVFSENNYDTVVHANNYLSKYKDLFKWTKEELILDIGCAAGRVTKEALYPFVECHLGHLIGADRSQEAIDVGNEIYKASKLSFKRLDIEETKECELYFNKFNHIFAFYLFHLIEDSDLWSKNVHKMLKPNGQVFASIVVESRNLVTLATDAQRKDKSKPWSKYIENLPDLFVNYGDKPKEVITNIFTNSGFIIEAMDEQRAIFSFKDFKSMKNTLVSGNHFLSHIPEELREDYIEDYFNKTLQYNYSHSNVISYEMDVITVLATKI